MSLTFNLQNIANNVLNNIKVDDSLLKIPLSGSVSINNMIDLESTNYKNTFYNNLDYTLGSVQLSDTTQIDKLYNISHILGFGGVLASYGYDAIVGNNLDFRIPLIADNLGQFTRNMGEFISQSSTKDIISNLITMTPILAQDIIQGLNTGKLQDTFSSLKEVFSINGLLNVFDDYLNISNMFDSEISLYKFLDIVSGNDKLITELTQSIIGSLPPNTVQFKLIDMRDGNYLTLYSVPTEFSESTSNSFESQAIPGRTRPLFSYGGSSKQYTLNFTIAKGLTLYSLDATISMLEGMVNAEGKGPYIIPPRIAVKLANMNTMYAVPTDISFTRKPPFIDGEYSLIDVSITLNDLGTSTGEPVYKSDFVVNNPYLIATENNVNSSEKSSSVNSVLNSLTPNIAEYLVNGGIGGGLASNNSLIGSNSVFNVDNILQTSTNLLSNIKW